MREVWNRAQGALTQESEVGAGAMHFVYGTAFGRLLARGILCRRFVSQLYAAWQKSPLSRGKVRRFLAQYDIDVSDCTQQTFRCFNDFFTRQRVRTNDRSAPDELPAIADSKLTALPIGEDSVFTVKDVSYRLGELLADDALAERFLGGWCLIFRLSPDDYHRYAYPDTGTQEPTVRIPGVLHSVNPIAGSLGVYRRNARARTLLHTEHFGDVVQMEVGAMLVGRICNHETGAAACARLQEKGYFEYGRHPAAGAWEVRTRRGYRQMVGPRHRKQGKDRGPGREETMSEHYKFFQNRECEYFPCHKTNDPEHFNCLFCFCPLYALGERCGGGLQYTESGIKDCSACLFPHRPENYDRICARFAELAALCRRPPEKG